MYKRMGNSWQERKQKAWYKVKKTYIFLTRKKYRPRSWRRFAIETQMESEDINHYYWPGENSLNIYCFLTL